MNSYPFIPAWKTYFNISCKADVLVINFLGFCLGKSLCLLHLWRTALRGIVFLADSFFFEYFEYIILLSPGLQTFCWEICTHIGLTHTWWIPFLLLLIRFSLCLWLWWVNYNVSWCNPVQVQPIWGLLGLMHLYAHFLHGFKTFSVIIPLNILLVLFSFSSPSGIPIMQILFLFILIHNSHRVFSLFFSLLFFFALLTG